jgi:ferric-dicitrate binding protein FerR (iron transport regulator)
MLIATQTTSAALPAARCRLRLRRAQAASLALAIGLLAPATEAAAQATRASAGQVEQVKGSATAVTSGTTRQLSAQTPVYVADTVRTGTDGRLTLKLGDRTMVRLGENTDLKIERYLLDAGGEIDLGAGSLQFERTGKPSATDLKVRSPYGLIAVRGTRFYAGRFLGVWGVFVARGAVDVTGGGKTVRVTTGLGSNVDSPGGRPSAPKAWGKPRVDAAIKATR